MPHPQDLSDLNTESGMQKSNHHSDHQGVIAHGEHLVDLILAQGGIRGASKFKAFSGIIEDLLRQIKRGRILEVNEKFDGSPSIVLGFDQHNKPFVAYKGGFLGQRTQKLITSSSDIQTHYNRASNLGKVLGRALKHTEPMLARLHNTEFSDFIFQGDVLFSPGDGKKWISDGKIHIKANHLEYVIGPESEHFESLKFAKVGIVIHTIGRRVINPSTERLDALPHEQNSKIEEFAELMRSKDVFVIHPWTYDLEVREEPKFSRAKEREISELLKDIKSRLKGLGVEFRAEWQKEHLARFRKFFNSGLRPPKRGGIYRAAFDDQPFDAKEIFQKFDKWLAEKVADKRVVACKDGSEKVTRGESQAYLERYNQFKGNHALEMENLFHSYYGAIRIQYLITPFIEPILRSKLGGGPVEGIMLSSNNTLVKWVDRLGFTMGNNAFWERGAYDISALRYKKVARPTNKVLPTPFDQWRPGDAFLIAKLQPPHIGHIKMIQKAKEMLGPGNRLYVLASDKAPKLTGETWQELATTEKKRDLDAKQYKYVLDTNLREEILRHSLPEGTEVNFCSPALFWEYLRRAKENGSEGSVKLVVGDKEIQTGRYNSHLKRFEGNLDVLSVPMQADSISGTKIRDALKEYSQFKSEDALEILESAFGFIVDSEARNQIIKRMVQQWRMVDRAARRFKTESRNRSFKKT